MSQQKPPPDVAVMYRLQLVCTVLPCTLFKQKLHVPGGQFM